MQFESDFRFGMDEGYSMCNPALTCPSASASFSSASSTSSAYDPFTPSSRRSTPNELSLEFDGGCQSFANSQHGELTPPPAMHKYMFPQVKTEPERLSFSSTDGTLPSTPLRKMNEMMPGYDHMLDMNLANHPMGSMTPSGPFHIYNVSPQTALQTTPFMMTPTHSLSGSEMAESTSSWCSNDSPISFFPPKNQSQDMEGLDLERYSQSPMGSYYLHGPPPSPHRLRGQRKMMVHEIQRKTTELQRAQIRVSRKSSDKQDSGPVDVVRRAMCKCDYPGCHKAFRRNEHLKRHKQTYHGEGPNRFSCEFCGKDQFNRQDNLNNHRKLHARPNSRNRGVEFIPAAVPVIEQEERSRKRRAPPRSKTAATAASEKREDF